MNRPTQSAAPVKLLLCRVVHPPVLAFRANLQGIGWTRLLVAKGKAEGLSRWHPPTLIKRPLPPTRVRACQLACFEVVWVRGYQDDWLLRLFRGSSPPHQRP